MKRLHECRLALTLVGQVPGLYSAGWVARGPVGVIASTMQNAYAVAQVIIDDHLQGQTRRIEATLPPEIAKSNRVVSLQDWQRIDQAELERGKPLGKLREKFTTVPDMLAVLHR